MAKAILVYDQQCMRFTRAHAVALGVAASMLAGAYLWSGNRQPEARAGVVVRPAQLTPTAVESAARQNPFAPVATEVVSPPTVAAHAAAQPPSAPAVEPAAQSPSQPSAIPEAPTALSSAQQQIDEAALQTQTAPLYEDSSQATMQAQEAAMMLESPGVETQAPLPTEAAQTVDPQALIQAQ